MTKMIQIRNVPEDMHRRLTERAAAARLSLSDYLKRELERVLSVKTMEEIFSRPPASDITNDEIVQIIREDREWRSTGSSPSTAMTTSPC